MKRNYYNTPGTMDALYREFRGPCKNNPCKSASYWREQALKDLENPKTPRQECEKCHIKYPHYYMVYVYTGSFTSGYVCKDCAKMYHFQKA